MDWGLIGVILAIVFGVVSVVSIIIAIKLAERRKPSWAFRTEQVVGLGSNSPPELKLTFQDTVINEVYRTKFIFFNRGNKPIVAKDDVIQPIIIRFTNAQILSERIIRTSNDDVMFVVRRANEGIEVGFKYLDHNDGAVVEVLHTESDDPDCQGKIMSVERISYLGDFDDFPKGIIGTSSKVGLIAGLLGFIALVGFILANPKWSVITWANVALVTIGLVMIGIITVFWVALPQYSRSRIFPRWSRKSAKEANIPAGQITGYCVKCRTTLPMREIRKIRMENEKPALQGTCPVCGTKMFRVDGAGESLPEDVANK